MKTREELLKEYEPHKPRKDEIVGWFKAADYDDIKQIINAPTQAQLDCPYCHPDYPKMKYQGFEFCPHCGRKLGDE